MSFQYLSEDQRARYRRFLTDPSPEDLERFFYLDAVALAEVAKKRGPHNRLGWVILSPQVPVHHVHDLG